MNISLSGSYNVETFEDQNLTVTADEINYVWPEGTIFAGRLVIETLEELVEMADGIVEAFARMVALRNTRA